MAAYWDVLTQTRDVVLALGVLADAGARGAVRKRPFFSKEHGDRFPFVTLSPVNEEVADLQMGNGAWIDYPVVVALWQQKGATLQSEAQLQFQLDAREAIRLALWRPDAVPLEAQFDCDYDPEPAFDLGALGEMFDVSLQLFTFRVSEDRADA